MARRSLGVIGVIVAGVALAVAACSSSGAPSAPASAAAPSGTAVAAVPSTAAPAPASAPAASAAVSSVPSLAAGTCSETKDAGAAAVSIKDFEFDPAAISAKVGQVIAFKNTGFEPHNATLDAGGCATSTLQTGKTDGLRFDVAGIYPFHCTVHTQMHGTITVTG